MMNIDQLLHNADWPKMMQARHLGGAGSGNFGHAGRPGQIGGSAGTTFSAVTHLKLPKGIQLAGVNTHFTEVDGPGGPIKVTQGREALLEGRNPGAQPDPPADAVVAVLKTGRPLVLYRSTPTEKLEITEGTSLAPQAATAVLYRHEPGWEDRAPGSVHEVVLDPKGLKIIQADDWDPIDAQTVADTAAERARLKAEGVDVIVYNDGVTHGYAQNTSDHTTVRLISDKATQAVSVRSSKSEEEYEKNPEPPGRSHVNEPNLLLNYQEPSKWTPSAEDIAWEKARLEKQAQILRAEDARYPTASAKERARIDYSRFQKETERLVNEKRASGVLTRRQMAQFHKSRIKEEEQLRLKTLGGAGSGNFGHAGRPGEVGGSAKGVFPTGLTKVGNAKGSNPGGIYKDATGQKWYVKHYSNVDQAAGEHAANAVYARIGIDTADSRISEDGKQIALRWQDGEILNKHGLDKDTANKILDGFAGDVFLQNWDAVGTGHDNVLVKPDGSVMRIDQGGTLLHRAQGAPKPEAGRHDIGEWESLRSSSMNPYYSQVFKKAGVTSGDALGERAAKQIDRIVAGRPSKGWESLIREVVPMASEEYKRKAGAMLEARQKKLEQKRDDLRARGLGGAGSGNFGHAGRPGQVGGSASAATAAGYEWKPKPESKSGNYAWYKDGQQVSGYGPKGEAEAVAKTIHGGKGIPGASVTKSASKFKPLTPAELAARSSETSKLLSSGKAKTNAILSIEDDPKERAALIASIGSGPALERAQKEYAQTPIADLRVLRSIKVENKPVSGQAHCTWDRDVVMGSTSVTGDFRHELGHAVHMSMSKDLQKYAEGLYHEAKAKAAKGPKNAQLTHEFYETQYGVIGRRALDNWNENFAEHYRGYHKAVYQSKGEDPKALSRYVERHPKWAALWDAHYTAVAK